MIRRSDVSNQLTAYQNLALSWLRMIFPGDTRSLCELPRAGSMESNPLSLSLYLLALSSTTTSLILETFPRLSGRYHSIVLFLHAKIFDNRGTSCDRGALGSSWRCTTAGSFGPLLYPRFTPVFVILPALDSVTTSATNVSCKSTCALLSTVATVR
ncbi:hypothetical protein BJY04DRAFT_28345 [Aspergillus karnatakaensis]|uniref:uncharacterized protein n=1 Tax=Aspergillus karnatakaensis TaxID=1810916 RepID=UPI003CCD2974